MFRAMNSNRIVIKVLLECRAERNQFQPTRHNCLLLVIMKLLTIIQLGKLVLATVGLQRPTILPSILTRLNPKEPSLETTWLRVLKNSADTRWLQHRPCYWPDSKWQKHLCATEEFRELSSCCCSLTITIAILFSMRLCLLSLFL